MVRATVALLSGAAVVGMTHTTAGADVSFAATGSAFGMRLIVTIPKAPLTPTPVDVGGPAAQAMLDSIGNERGLAALPFPGDAVLSGPGTLAGVLASTPLSAVPLPGLPAYPFYVQADAQKPKASSNLPFADMESSVSADAVAASVRTPGTPEDSPAGMRASSTITHQPGGGVRTVSASSITGLAVGPLTIGSVTSTATMALQAGGGVTRQSTFAARALSIGGVSVDMTPEGFSAGGSPLPFTAAKTFSDALTGAGIDIALLPASQTSTSVVAAALQVTRHQDFGPGGSGGSITLILGQSTVSLTGAPRPVLPGLAGILPFTTVPSRPVAPTESLPAGGTGGATSLGGVPSTTPLVPPAALAPARPASPATTVAGSDARRPVAERFDTAPAYWAIAVAVLLTVVAGPALRLVLTAVSPR
jgi:hypothetical protein